MNIEIEQITPELASKLCRTITADLPEYFGLPDVNEHYAVGMLSRHSLAAKVGGQEIGKELMQTANAYAHENGASSMTVETLAPYESDENYLKTYRFYEQCGFKPLFNLKPGGYEWNMVYMSKEITSIIGLNIEKYFPSFKLLAQQDIPSIVTAFTAIGWNKPASIYEKYLKEQEVGQRVVWIAWNQDNFAGYVTLLWKSKYEHFQVADIPEISDLNVLPQYRCQGIGSKLLDLAEKESRSKSNQVGLGVGLYEDYGNAHKLYLTRGYMPDGRGITYRNGTVK
jgi:GNAT superfamily N-acetyltransferase